MQFSDRIVFSKFFGRPARFQTSNFIGPYNLHRLLLSGLGLLFRSLPMEEGVCTFFLPLFIDSICCFIISRRVYHSLPNPEECSKVLLQR